MSASKKKRSPNTGSLPARQRPDGRWEARLTLPDGRRRSFYGATWEEAERKLTDARADLEKGALAEPGRATVAEVGADFFRLNPLGFRKTTLRVRQNYWSRWVNPAIGHVRLSRLSVQHVLLAIARMREANLSLATINNTITAMVNVFNYAVSARLLGDNPAKHVKRETENDPRDLPITSADQLTKLLEAVKASSQRCALMLGLGLGLRSGEVRALRWREIDFERRIIRVRHSVARIDGAYEFTALKTKSSRRDLPMPDFIYHELKDERRRQTLRRLQAGPAWIDRDLVCTNSGEVLSHSTLAKEMVRLRRVTGIEGLVFHHLRHLCATVMMLNNVPPRIAQGVLGHATSATTMRIYQHVNSDALRDAADAINAAFGHAIRDQGTA
jgi:integrase